MFLSDLGAGGARTGGHVSVLVRSVLSFGVFLFASPPRQIHVYNTTSQGLQYILLKLLGARQRRSTRANNLHAENSQHGHANLEEFNEIRTLPIRKPPRKLSPARASGTIACLRGSARHGSAKRRSGRIARRRGELQAHARRLSWRGRAPLSTASFRTRGGGAHSVSSPEPSAARCGSSPPSPSAPRPWA